MFLHTVLRTKIIPPPRGARTLSRPRVNQTLGQAFDHRLTILQAGAGYGKSTALAELTVEIKPIVWYQVGEEDNDPLVFLLRICHAIKEALPDVKDLPITFLESWEGGQGPLPWRGVLDQVINALSNHLFVPALFILDDAHQVTETGEVPHLPDRLVGLAPANFHVLLSGRPTISLPNLSRWRAKGEVLSLDQTALTFTADEITALFATHYKVELPTEEASSLLAYTEGWAIALQLIWQNLRAQSAPSLDFPSHWQAASLDALFDLLAREVFAGQSSDVRDFLLITSTLRDLKPEVCDALLRKGGNAMGDSASMLAYLRRQDLFTVETVEGVLRYHHIFHDFLRQQSTFEQRQKWNRSAADYFAARNDPESVIYHLLEAQAWDAVADMLDQYSVNLLNMGRLDTLAAYIDSLPPEILHLHLMLIFTLGELARLHSRFDEALGWYKQAETTWRNRGQQDGIARALRGQAHVYLDTVDPSKAEQLLEEAIRLSDGFEDREAQVRLFELLAENKLNSGRVDEAERLRQRAEDLRWEGPTNDQLWFRVLLHTGRFVEARRELEKHAETEKEIPVQTPRAHRETLLLLSFIPERDAGSESAYILREGTTYGLRPNADLWLDAEEFTKAVNSAKESPPLLQRAVDLFAGEYLPDTIYEMWAAEERERLSALFLETADHLVETMIRLKRYTEAVDLCQRILSQDNCWERAYRHLMLAYDGLGDRGQVGRVYQRCVQTLREELDLGPAPETQKLYERLTSSYVDNLAPFSCLPYIQMRRIFLFPPL